MSGTVVPSESNTVKLRKKENVKKGHNPSFDALFMGDCTDAEWYSGQVMDQCHFEDTFYHPGFQGCSPLKDELLNKYVPTFSEQIDAIHCLQLP